MGTKCGGEKTGRAELQNGKKKRIQIHQKSQEISFQIQHFVMFNVDLHMQV
jgi:hypothetical protein